MKFTTNHLPPAGTRLRVTTADGSRYHGRLRHHHTHPDGTTTIGVIEGAGWWNLALDDITTLVVTGEAKPVRLTNGVTRPTRLAFAA